MAKKFEKASKLIRTGSSAQKARRKTAEALVADLSGMATVDGHRVPLPGKESPETDHHSYAVREAQFPGLHEVGRTELCRIEEALLTYIKAIEDQVITCDAASHDPLPIDELRRIRLSEYAVDALTQTRGLLTQLDRLADSDPGVRIYYRGDESDKTNDGSRDLAFEELLSRQSENDSSGGYGLFVKGLGLGLILSRIAIWMYVPHAHMEAGRKQGNANGGGKSACLNGAQKKKVADRFNELMRLKPGANQRDLLQTIQNELTKIPAGRCFAGSPIRRVPSVDTLKKQLNSDDGKKPPVPEPNPERDLLNALWSGRF